MQYVIETNFIKSQSNSIESFQGNTRYYINYCDKPAIYVECIHERIVLDSINHESAQNRVDVDVLLVKNHH